MHDHDSIEAWTQRIANEFMECPGLRLTAAQASRFWGIDPSTVELVLDQLVRRARLARSADGTYIRPTDVRRRS